MNMVSVIIPTHNRSKMLERAIESVLEQTYKHFELIIVDDDSIDDTPKTVREIDDPRIRYHRNETNRGGSGSRNVGIGLSKYGLIAFLDDDDMWLPTKLEKQVAVLECASDDHCGVYTGLVKIRDGTAISKKVNRAEGDLFDELLWENIIGSTSCVLLRKECVKEVGGFKEGLPASQELELYLRLSLKYKFKSIPEPLVKYSIHENKQITSDYSKKIASKKYIYERYKTYFASNRKLHAKHHYELSFMEYMDGDRKLSGQHFKKAFLLYPAGVKHIIRMTLSKLILGI